MDGTQSYRVAFFAAVLLHLVMAFFLFIEPSTQQPVLMLAKENATKVDSSTMEVQPIKAVSVESQQVIETVNRLKRERLQQRQAEEARQLALSKQAEVARKQRMAEQQHLEKLKEEAHQLALARERQALAEQRRLEQLAKQAEAQEKRLADMKKLQQEEAQRLLELEKKKALEMARLEKAEAQKKQAELERKRQQALQQAQLDAEQNARMAGEVDKYKALILQAISQQWILPDTADSSKSCQFRIRLAPNGLVLEVSLTESSGDPILDRSAQSAIYKASPLPVPSDPKTFDLFRTISLTVRPENARG